jgi:hypothetical protein
MGVVILLAFLAGCGTPGGRAGGGTQKPVVKVRWQRLLSATGQTCERCGSTERATEDGVRKLRRCLKPVGVDVVLEKTSLDAAGFSKDPLQSNRIWVGEKPIEDWLQAKVSKSQCCGPCGDSECRILTVDGKTYEVVPAELIVKAGLLAGAELMGSQPGIPCNPMGQSAKGPPVCCPAPAGGEKK